MMLLVFTLDECRCALELSSVEKVYRAVAITPLPGAPGIVLGIINVKGVILPVVDIRQRFKLPEKSLTPNNQFVIAHASDHLVVLIVDEIIDVIQCSEQNITSANTIISSMDHVEGVARLENGLIFIHDLTRFLSLEEKFALDRALNGF